MANEISEDIKVLVTGGLGFIGSAIVRALQEQHPKWTVSILDMLEDPRSGRKEAQEPSDDDFDLLRGCTYEYFKADITEEMDVLRAFEQARPGAVVHAAGIVPSLSERYSRRLEPVVKNINVNGTKHVVGAAKKLGCRALVYTSSCCAVTDDMSKPYANIDERWPVGERNSIYGESKVEAEGIVIAANTAGSRSENGAIDHTLMEDTEGSRAWPLLTCVLRPAVVFGEGDEQLIPPIHACIAKGESRYKIGDGSNLWDTVYVGNIADAHVLALENLLRTRSGQKFGDIAGRHGFGNHSDHGGIVAGSAAGEIFFIQNNEPISFREFSLGVWKEFDHFPPSFEVQIPERLAWVLGLIAEGFSRISGTPTTLSPGSVMDACAMRYASGDKARRILGYQPRVGLEVGLKRSCQDYARRLTRRIP
ncbi:sterol-4alpha-carboxylate 3-dehydrogenase [Exophiala viscosa]|uniref:sterol-4alpha-carboxylate 3-dehydrogenase n=1 Tax=Exophiala viscosa TaxID=2486360 RepID=UPI00219B8B0A|nr:sterol-4alpha-carboxylate 3-dehydrogenase [Exophiala viscosa]